MTYAEKIISFHIAERDGNQNFLTWSYPSITNTHEKFVLQNCFKVQTEYICLRKNDVWFYIVQQTINTKTVAIILLTKEFEPKKYRLLCDILGRTYLKCQNPVELVKLYLNLFTSGSCSVQENGRTYSCDMKNFKSSANLKDFIQSFDMEIILIYTALLLKRRILVLCSKSNLLLNDLFSIMNLIPSRRIEEYLYPLIEDAKKLKGLSFYVAGTHNSDFVKESHLYDLFINLETREISISPKAEEIMNMGKLHKEIAIFLVKLSASDLSEVEIKKQSEQKIKDLLKLLQTIASVTTENNVKMIVMSDLKAKNYQPATESFLFNLALAENMMIL